MKGARSPIRSYCVGLLAFAGAEGAFAVLGAVELEAAEEVAGAIPSGEIVVS